MRVLFLFAISIGVFAQPTPVLTVCEALRSRLAIDGKMVTIRSHVTGTMEGAWLDSDECPGVVKETDFVWQSSIVLENTSTAAELHPVDFDEDRALADRAGQKYRRLRKRSPVYLWLRPRWPERCIEFVVTGQFGTRATFSKLTYPDGSFFYLGFGHVNGSPAQLVVKAMVDVVVSSDCR